MPAALATPAITPDRFESDARGVDVDFQHTLEQFPSEETLEINSLLGRRAVDSAVSTGVDTPPGIEPFLSEPKLLVIVPAGPPVFAELAGEHERWPKRAPVDRPRPSRPSVVARAVTSVSPMLSSIAMAPIRLARAAVSVALRLATVIGAGCRAAVGQVTMGTAGVLRRVKRMLSSIAMAPIRLARAAVSVALRPATVIGAGCRAAVGQVTMGTAGVLRRVKRLAVTSVSGMLRSGASTSIRLTRTTVSVALRRATMIDARCRAAIGQVAMGSAGVLRRAKQLAFGLGRIKSSTGVAIREAWRVIVCSVRFAFELTHAAGPAVRRTVASASLALRSGCAAVASGIAGSVRTIAQRSLDIVRALKSTIGISADGAVRSVRSLAFAMARPLRPLPRSGTIRTRRFPIVTRGHSKVGLASRLASAAYGIPAALIMATVVATLVFVITPPNLPAVVRMSDPPRQTPATDQPAVERISDTVKETLPGTTSGGEHPDRGAAPTPPPKPRPIDAAAIQRVLNRYRDAYSTLDVAAVRAIWPSVDAPALRTTFDRLAEHNVEYDSCKISAADAGAVAVCSGVAQSVPMGARKTTTERRQWRFVLSTVKNRWLIETVAAH
jgi:hypothetical protein